MPAYLPTCLNTHARARAAAARIDGCKSCTLKGIPLSSLKAVLVQESLMGTTYNVMSILEGGGEEDCDTVGAQLGK